MASPCKSEGLEQDNVALLNSQGDFKLSEDLIENHLNVGVDIIEKEMNSAADYEIGDEINQRSNNATSLPLPLAFQGQDYVETTQHTDKISPDDRDTLHESPDVLNLCKPSECSNHLEGQVNYSYQSDSDEDVCVVRRSRSDEHLVIKHHAQTREEVEGLDQEPSSISDVGDDEHLEVQHEFDCRCPDCNNGETEPPPEIHEVCTESPSASRDEAPYDDDDSQTSEREPAEDRIASIEVEYIHRISSLEERHYELEDVLARLTSALEAMFVEPEANATPVVETDASDPQTSGADTAADDKTENEAKGNSGKSEDKETYSAMYRNDRDKKALAKMIGLELFIEFQQKIRHFAADLNGVLNCCEAGIRHARVVQEWAGRVQTMFENMKEERQQMLSYIDEKEKGVIIMKNQFLSELESQGRQLCAIVQELQTNGNLEQKAEEYCRNKIGDHTYMKKPLEESIIDALLTKRIEGDKAIALDLAKQSKISEQKLFIVHQHLCIQQLQEQNRELKAIVEGLMGPDDSEYDDEACDGEPTSTPASVSTPDQCPVREALDRMPDPQLSKVTDVLYCDRGEYLPGHHTDGDIATIQAYNIGEDADKIEKGDNIVFDPLKVPYVREQCQRVEDEERIQNEAKDQATTEETSADAGVQTLRNGVEALNIQAYLRKCLEDEDTGTTKKPQPEGPRRHVLMDDQDAAGDNRDVMPKATLSAKSSPEKAEAMKQEMVHSGETAIDDVVTHTEEADMHSVKLSDVPDPISPIVEV